MTVVGLAIALVETIVLTGLGGGWANDVYKFTGKDEMIKCKRILGDDSGHNIYLLWCFKLIVVLDALVPPASCLLACSQKALPTDYCLLPSAIYSLDDRGRRLLLHCMSTWIVLRSSRLKHTDCGLVVLQGAKQESNRIRGNF